MTLSEFFKEWRMCRGGKLEADIRGMIAAKDAALAKLREQRDRLILKRYVENVTSLQYGMSMVDAQRIVDAEIAEEFSVRIIDGKVEEIGNG